MIKSSRINSLKIDCAHRAHSTREIVRARPYREMGCIALLAALVGTAGCISMGGDYGSVVTAGQKAGIVKEKTTKTDILRELGNPDQKIDLGNNKEQFSYITERVRTKGGLIMAEIASQYTEFWIVFENNVVTETGERPTTKAPNYFK